MKKDIIRRGIVTGLFSVSILLSSSAWAGFEWRPAPKTNETAVIEPVEPFAQNPEVIPTVPDAPPSFETIIMEQPSVPVTEPVQSPEPRMAMPEPVVQPVQSMPEMNASMMNTPMMNADVSSASQPMALTPITPMTENTWVEPQEEPSVQIQSEPLPALNQGEPGVYKPVRRDRESVVIFGANDTARQQMPESSSVPVVSSSSQPEFVPNMGAPSVKTHSKSITTFNVERSPALSGLNFVEPLPVRGNEVVQNDPVEPANQMANTVSEMPVSAPLSLSDKAIVAPVSGQGDVVEGFGKDLPLMIAVRQIAPVDYEFSFEDGVDVGGFVSWQGGESWRVVMGKTLSDAGLDYRIQDNIITVYRANMVAEPVVTTASTDMKNKALAVPAIEQEVSVSQAVSVPPQPVMDQPSMPVVNYQAPAKEVLPVVNLQPPVDKKGDDVWYGAKDSTLRTVLRDWSSEANVELYWNSEYDYPLKATVVVNGTFENAVQKILEGFDQAQPRPIGRLHRNSGQGPSVLVVEANSSVN